MAKLTGYWWECRAGKCQHKTKQLPTQSGSVPSYIRDSLIKSKWNQKLLLQDCKRCGARKSMRITFDFPQNETGKLQVLHMVGLDEFGKWVPMLWETKRMRGGQRRLHFNYMNGKNPFGLNRAPVLTPHEIQTLLERYHGKTGKLPFRFTPAE
jgi:hypothetical protein